MAASTLSLTPLLACQRRTQPAIARSAAAPVRTRATARLQWRSSVELRAAGGAGRRTRVATRAARAPCVRAAVSDAPPEKLIDGKKIAGDVRAEIRAEVEALKAKTGKVPGLAVVLVGGRKDSETYVRSKKKACEEAGIVSFGTDLPEDVSENELLQVVRTYNADPEVNGILVQLPLPAHIDEEKVLSAIDYEKDVDGFHPLNMGFLAQRGRNPMYVACTPKGCIELLERSGVEIAGKNAVVIGRSNIVGMPATLLLMRRDATVTVVHSRTPNAKEITQQADIVVAACGRAEMVRGDWIKPGAAVIDVGINAVDDATKKRGYRLVGDVCFDEAVQNAALITPVPGGVGPMTIAMLLQNTLEGFKRSLAKAPVASVDGAAAGLYVDTVDANDPMEQFCADAPDADECRVYDD